MRIKSTQRLQIEDFPDQKDWLGKLLDPLNAFITQAVKILNGGELFSDNVSGVEHDFEFKFVSNAKTFPMSFMWNIGLKPKCLVVCQALEGETPIAVAVAWKLNNDNEVELAQVTKITATPTLSLLTVGTAYKIKVRVTP